MTINEIDSLNTNLGKFINFYKTLFKFYDVLVDCSIKSRFKSELVTLNEEKHAKLTECSSKIKCRKGSVDLGDFFGGRTSLLSN